MTFFWFILFLFIYGIDNAFFIYFTKILTSYKERKNVQSQQKISWISYLSNTFINKLEFDNQYNVVWKQKEL